MSLTVPPQVVKSVATSQDPVLSRVAGDPGGRLEVALVQFESASPLLALPGEQRQFHNPDSVV